MNRMSLMCASALAVSGGAAFAEEAPTDVRRSVLEQLRRDFQPTGRRAGAFVVSPVARAGVHYTDNLFAVPSEFDASAPALRNEPKDAVVYTLSAGASIETDWPVHGARLYGDVTTERVPEFNNEAVTSYIAGGEAFLELGDAGRVTLGGNYGEFFDERDNRFTPRDAASRIEWTRSVIKAAATRKVGSVKLRAEAERSVFDFEDGVDLAGQPIEQDTRDYAQNRFVAQADVDVTSGTYVFVRGQYSQARFDVEPTVSTGSMGEIIRNAVDADSNQYGVLGGVGLDLTNLLYGEVAVGYATRNFEDPTTDNASFFTIDVDLEWYVQPDTTVMLTAERDNREAVALGLLGQLRTGVEGTIERKLRYNLAAALTAGYERSTFDGFVLQEDRPVDREDEDLYVGAKLVYYMRPGINATLSYTHLDRTSTGPDAFRPFENDRVGLILSAAL